MKNKELEEKRSFWREKVNEHLLSGESQSQFCKKHGLIPHKFSYFSLKFKKEENLSKKTASSFAQVFSEKPAQKKKEILPKLPDPKWLATFLKEFYASN